LKDFKPESAPKFKNFPYMFELAYLLF